MASTSEAPVIFHQLPPTQPNLTKLLEKLLTVFGVESILEGGVVPKQPLQREIGGTVQPILRPMVGNDFHIQTSFGCGHAWKALLQLISVDWADDADAYSEVGKICVPLCNIALYPNPEEATATKLAERVAKLLRAAWPDASVGPSKRKQLGPQFDDYSTPDYQLFRWIASKDLNPISEGVFLTHLQLSKQLLYLPLRHRTRGLQVKPCPVAEMKQIAVIHFPDLPKPVITAAEIWSFTGPDNWVISLPMFALILLLATHPTKEANPLEDNPDRDLSWTLDSLHGFCRMEGFEEGNRRLSWSLGTFPDRWMYFNFIFHYFVPDFEIADEWIGSGIRCQRQSISLPLGGPNGKEIFRERRVWLSLRTSTPYRDNYQADGAKQTDPATVGFVLADAGHHPNAMKKKTWVTRSLEAVEGASGVTAFQMLVWGGVDEWSEGWNRCLNYIEKLHELQVEDIIDGGSSKLDTFMNDADGTLAREYYVTASLLKIFRRQMDIMPRSLRQMVSKWDQTYPGVDSDLTQRFNEPAQLALLRNWSRLTNHAEALHKKLILRVEKMTAELLRLRDSLNIARS